MSTVDELRATAHPIRLRLLSLLTGVAMSAAEAGRELGLSQATASYHLRVLERAGLVRVVEDQVHPLDPEAAEDRLVYLDAVADELRRRARAHADGPGVTTDAELWVDPETWRRVVQHIGQASAILHAAARPPRTPGTRPVSVTAALFPLRRS